MNNTQQRPVARREGLVIQEMPDEILVYDLETHKAHCLNETAAFVWKACDGAHSIRDITEAFGSRTGRAVPESLVWLAIDQLNESRLLAAEVETDFKGQTRREVIKKIGLAAVVALPIVSSLIAPTAALAATCSVANNQPCTGNGNTGRCCGGNCCENQTFACNPNNTCGA